MTNWSVWDEDNNACWDIAPLSQTYAIVLSNIEKLDQSVDINYTLSFMVKFAHTLSFRPHLQEYDSFFPSLSFFTQFQMIGMNETGLHRKIL